MTDDRPKSGAKLRRRGLYGPPPRLTRTSPLVGRLLWHIGDWGRASEHIGGRWEHVAAALARAHVGSDNYLVVLAATPTLMTDVLSSGLPHADALNTWREDGQLALEPLDFKWSLETASARQVSQETLARLLAAELSSLETALREARDNVGLAADADLQPRDGRFVAPEHPANRAALRAEPGLPSLLLPVDPKSFFDPLPGWRAARVLAHWEGGDLDRLTSVEPVERYYRLGAGVTGALTRLRMGLFETEPPTVDATAALEELRRSGIATTLNTLLVHLEQRLTERRALDERLAQLPRSAYPFGRLRADFARAGVPKAILESRGALGRAYAEVMRDLTSAVRAAGQELVASGTATEAALDQLAADPQRWANLGSQHARGLAARLSAAK